MGFWFFIESIMTNQVTITNSVISVVDGLSTALNSYLSELGLPTENVLVDLPERRKIINNLPDVVNGIEATKRQNSLYLSKFIAACGAGLFDAALNFIWDETVVNLRLKVIRFDLEYFYDSVVTEPTRRAKLKDESDLVKIEEWELIRGCHVTGILSDIGFKHLDYIRDMRNWASAAHPNQNQLTGFQLIAWLETCINEVIAKEPEAAAVEVKRVLTSIRNNILTPSDAEPIKAGFEYLPLDLVSSLLRTLFGMYTAEKTSVNVRSNINLIAKKCWTLAPDEAKYECGLKYSNFAANGELARKELAKSFLTVVDGLPYLPSDTLALEISEKIQNLYTAHHGMNNFYNEPAHAKALTSYVSDTGVVPDSVRHNYVKTVVMVKIGNGYGISNMAETYYDEMINKFGELELKEFVKLVLNTEFSARLHLSSCAKNFKQLSGMLISKSSNQITLQALTRLSTVTGQQLPILISDTQYQQLMKSY